MRQKILKDWVDAISCAERHTDDEPFAVRLGDLITKSTKSCTKQLMFSESIKNLLFN